VTSLFKLIVTCPCSLRTWCHAEVYSSFIIIISPIGPQARQEGVTFSHAHEVWETMTLL